MIKRIALWAVVAVASVLAVQILLREGPPPSLVAPPSMKLPAASGETFELTVAVTFDREWYYGCGRRISYR